MPAPRAARIGSFTIATVFAPDSKAAFVIALFSLGVMPAGALITRSGLKKLKLPRALLMKYLSIARVI